MVETTPQTPYNEGDKVTTLVAKPGIPVGSEGIVGLADRAHVLKDYAYMVRFPSLFDDLGQPGPETYYGHPEIKPLFT